MAAKSTCLSADMSVPLLATGAVFVSGWLVVVLDSVELAEHARSNVLIFSGEGSAGDGDDEVLQRILSKLGSVAPRFSA